jgi:iron(III) transport system substrate-binding protein
MYKKLFVIVLLVISFISCSGKEDNSVVIFSSAEDFRNEHISARLKEQFPSYDVVLQYLPTGNNAAKLKAEGSKTECDIVIGLESAYMENIQEVLAPLHEYDSAIFLDELVPTHKKYLPWEKQSGAIMINAQLLQEKGLPVPSSYQDLLKPEYKNLIAMPNPKSSGTGYFFLKNLVNVMGEDAAFAYFDALAENVLQFTSSGSGPVNMLVQGEIPIGLGLAFQAVNQINQGVDLDILYFAEGSPYSITGFGIIDGKETKPAVKEVFNFVYSTLVYEDKELFSPEQIFKNQVNKIPNYPQNIQYADMTGISDIHEKEQLLAKWKY